MVSVGALMLAGLSLTGLASGSAGAAGAEWNVVRIKAPMSASGTTIAVVDTGVDASHPAFGGRILPQIDFVGDGKKGDPEGHGTHVSGTAAGGVLKCGNDRAELGVGVAPDAKILPVRVLDEDGSGTSTDVADGIRAAADKGVTVINLSLGEDVIIQGLSSNSRQFIDAVNYAWSKGSIPVLAAGNDGLGFGGVFGSGYGDLNAVVVTATDNRDRVAGYATSIGSAKWGVSAPGGDSSGQVDRDVMSAFPGSQCALSAGTSMAAPHVAGALAVLRSKGLNQQQAVDRLLATARDLGASGEDATYGHGLVDLAAAVQGLGGGTPTPPATQPAPPVTNASSSPPVTSATTTPRRGGVPATRPPSSSTPSTTETSTTLEPGDIDDVTAVDSDVSDRAGADLEPAESGDESAAGQGAGGDGGSQPGAPLVGLAVLFCAGGWALSGRAALSLRR